MFKKMFLSFIGCLIAVLAIGNINAQAAEITVSAAISLKNAFEELGKLYESKNAGTKVILNFGASGDLARQIEGGAPVDVFASAAQKDMDAVDQKGLLAPSTRKNFAKNAVVLIKPVSSKIGIKGFDDLKKPEIKKVSIGNPQTVPAGRYAQEILTHFKVWDAIKDKLVFAENVRQVLDYVSKNEVDAGVVYSTDAMVRPEDVSVVTKSPDDAHKPIVYPIAVVKESKKQDAAKAFTALVVSEEGIKILQKYGFEAVR